LQPELLPGSFVVPHQLVDRTHSRDSSFGETGAFHVSFADPYCSAGRDVLVEAGARMHVPLTSEGVMVVIEGPRFSTRAESQSLGREGWSLVNMTGMPEAVLARELAMCYSALAVVTDYDAGVDADAAVHQDDVFAGFERSLSSLRDVLAKAVALLPRDRACRCGRALQGMSSAHLPAHRRPGHEVPAT
jgi:5'-methylthioadenosine phosphorylase